MRKYEYQYLKYSDISTIFLRYSDVCLLAVIKEFRLVLHTANVIAVVYWRYTNT